MSDFNAVLPEDLTIGVNIYTSHFILFLIYNLHSITTYSQLGL